MTCNNSVNIFLLGLASSMKTDIRTTNENEQQLMTFAYAFTVTFLVVFGLTSNIISINTFQQIQIRSTAVGFSLLIYSCCSIFGLIMLQCRLFQLIDTLSYIPFFIICNPISSLASIFTRICLWLNGFIGLERSLFSFEHNGFLNRIRKQSFAIKQIIIIIICIFAMHIQELICRVVLPDPVAPNKFVCQIKYSSQLLLLNQIFSFFHIFIPFSLHIFAICLIMVSISFRQARIHRTTYRKQWIKQFRTHAHLFLAPITAMICTLPQLILSLKYSCVDISLKWLLRLNTSANLIIYIPQSLTFFMFIYHSEVYFKVFREKTIFGKYLWCKYHRNNQVASLQTMNTLPNNNIRLGTKLTGHISDQNRDTQALN